MAEQLSLFGSESETQLEITNVKFLDKRYTCAEELFQGFNHLYAITFSYGLDFVRKVVGNFDTAEIILGCEAMVKFDVQHIMAFQTRALEEVKKYEPLIQMVADDTLSFWVAKEMLSHQKIFILTSDDGKSRVITGSANFSARSFSGNQREFISVFENDVAALDYFLDEFETLKEFSTNEVVKDCLYITAPLTSEEHVTSIPIIKEAKVKQAGIILDNDIEANEIAEFVYDIQSLSEKYAPMVPKVTPDANKVLITPQKVKEMVRKFRINPASEKQMENAQFHINYKEGIFSFNGAPYRFDTDIMRVAQDLTCINDYFAGFDTFIGDVANSKRILFQFMNYVLLSPFIAKLRYEASRTDYPLQCFPMYAVLNGPKSAGKSAFMETMHTIMYGVPMKGISQNNFTKTGVNQLLHTTPGIAIHIEDITRERFTSNAGGIIKFENDIILEKLINHPVFIMTSNEIETVGSDLSKRVVYAAVDAQLTNVVATQRHKKMATLRRKISTSFYREYLKRMYPKVMQLISDMLDYEVAEEGEIWTPDIFAVSSETILEIYRDCGIDVPDFASRLVYSDYFGNNVIRENIRKRIIFEWTHNKKAFKILKKQNLVEYTPGERAYEAKRIKDSLPEHLRADVAGNKVVFLLDEGEEFFGITFKKWPL